MLTKPYWQMMTSEYVAYISTAGLDRQVFMYKCAVARHLLSTISKSMYIGYLWYLLSITFSIFYLDFLSMIFAISKFCRCQKSVSHAACVHNDPKIGPNFLKSDKAKICNFIKPKLKELSRKRQEFFTKTFSVHFTFSAATLRTYTLNHSLIMVRLIVNNLS